MGEEPGGLEAIRAPPLNLRGGDGDAGHDRGGVAPFDSATSPFNTPVPADPKVVNLREGLGSRLQDPPDRLG
jgi:hypothetical protein